MIQIGVNEDIVVSSVSKNDRGSLVIKLKEGGEVDPFQMFNNAGNTRLKADEKDMIIYPPSVTNFSGETDSYENIMKKIAEIIDPLAHILHAYTPKSAVKFDVFANLGLTKENIMEKVRTQAVVDKMYANIVDQFIKQITPFTGDNGKKQRVLLIRQSKAKHYPAFRKRFLESQPFFEPMDVPKEASKLAFSKFEIENGLNSGEAVGGAQTVSEEEKNSVETLFTTN